MGVRSMRSIIFTAVCSVVSLQLHAQQQGSASTFSLSGTVIDTLGLAVPFAQVFVFDNADLGTTADDDGRFRLDRLPLAKTRFAVRRIGYDPVYFDVDAPVAAVVEVEIRMRQNVRMLTTVEVKDEVRSPLSREGFYERMAAGHGLFVTPEMIAAIRPVRATDALTSIPNVVVHRRGSRTRITGASQQFRHRHLCDRSLSPQSRAPRKIPRDDLGGRVRHDRYLDKEHDLAIGASSSSCTIGAPIKR